MSTIARQPGGPGQPDRVKYSERVGVIDISSAIEQRAREIAESKLTESKQESAGVSGFLRKLWRHNLLRDYYRQVEISKARQRILSRGEFYSSDPEVERRAQQAGAEAILERFLREEPLLHPEAGERVHESKDTEAENLVKTQITNLVREYASGRINEAEFDKRKIAYIASARRLDPKVLDRGDFHVENLVQIAREVREIVEAGIAIENIDIDLEVTLGRARMGARTETEFNRVDRVMEMVSRSPLKIFQKSISRALGLMSSAGSFFSGGFVGAHEKERIANERKLHERQRAVGLTFNPATDRRRQELEQVGFDRVSAAGLALGVSSTAEILDTRITADSVADAVIVWAEAEARVRISDAKKIDLLSYSSVSAVESERARLDLARAEAAARIKAIFTDPRFSDDEKKGLLPPGVTNIEAFMANKVEVQKSRFTDPEDGDIARQNKLARKLGNNQTLWFRTPLEKMHTSAERSAIEEREREAARARSLAVAPTPPADAASAEPSPADVGADPGIGPVEEPEAEPDAEIKPFFEAKGSILDFRNKTGAEITPALVQKMYGEYAKTGRFDLIADLRRGTGVSFEEGELRTLIAGLDIYGRSSLLAAVPEVAPLIPWATALQGMEAKLPHGLNPDQDPWFVDVAPMVNELVSSGLIDQNNPGDGELVAGFVGGFGAIHAPELMKTWVGLKRAANVAEMTPADRSKLVEWLGADAETKTTAEVETIISAKFDGLRSRLLKAEALTPETADLGLEMTRALEAKRQELFGSNELAQTIVDLKSRIETARGQTASEVFTTKKTLILVGLREQVNKLRSQIDDAGQPSTLSRMLINDLETKIGVISSMSAPSDNQPATIRKMVGDLAQLGLNENSLNDLLAISYFQVYDQEHPKLRKMLDGVADVKIVDGRPENLTAAKVGELTTMLIDKMVREDLPKSYKNGPSYHAILRALGAHNPEGNPLAQTNSRIDEFRGLSSRRKIPVGAMPEAETKALLAFRASHDLQDARNEISRTVSAVVRSEISARGTDVVLRRLLNLAQLNKADGDLALAKKDFLTAELLAQKSLRLCHEILFALGVEEAMTEQDRVRARAAEVAEKKRLDEERAARELEAAELKAKVEEGMDKITKGIEKLEIGIEDLDTAKVSVESLREDLESFEAREEELVELFNADKVSEVKSRLRQFIVDLDRVNNIISRLRREHNVRAGRRRVADDEPDRAPAAAAGAPVAATPPVVTGTRNIFGAKAATTPVAEKPEDPTRTNKLEAGSYLNALASDMKEIETEIQALEASGADVQSLKNDLEKLETLEEELVELYNNGKFTEVYHRLNKAKNERGGSDDLKQKITQMKKAGTGPVAPPPKPVAAAPAQPAPTATPGRRNIFAGKSAPAAPAAAPAAAPEAPKPTPEAKPAPQKKAPPAKKVKEQEIKIEGEDEPFAKPGSEPPPAPPSKGGGSPTTTPPKRNIFDKKT